MKKASRNLSVWISGGLGGAFLLAGILYPALSLAADEMTEPAVAETPPAEDATTKAAEEFLKGITDTETLTDEGLAKLAETFDKLTTEQQEAVRKLIEERLAKAGEEPSEEDKEALDKIDTTFDTILGKNEDNEVAQRISQAFDERGSGEGPAATAQPPKPTEPKETKPPEVASNSRNPATNDVGGTGNDDGLDDRLDDLSRENENEEDGGGDDGGGGGGGGNDKGEENSGQESAGQESAGQGSAGGGGGSSGSGQQGGQSKDNGIKQVDLFQNLKDLLSNKQDFSFLKSILEGSDGDDAFTKALIAIFGAGGGSNAPSVAPFNLAAYAALISPVNYGLGIGALALGANSRQPRSGGSGRSLQLRPTAEQIAAVGAEDRNFRSPRPRALKEVLDLMEQYASVRGTSRQAPDPLAIPAPQREPASFGERISAPPPGGAARPTHQR